MHQVVIEYSERELGCVVAMHRKPRYFSLQQTSFNSQRNVHAVCTRISGQCEVFFDVQCAELSFYAMLVVHLPLVGMG